MQATDDYKYADNYESEELGAKWYADDAGDGRFEGDYHRDDDYHARIGSNAAGKQYYDEVGDNNEYENEEYQIEDRHELGDRGEDGKTDAVDSNNDNVQYSERGGHNGSQSVSQSDDVDDSRARENFRGWTRGAEDAVEPEYDRPPQATNDQVTWGGANDQEINYDEPEHRQYTEEDQGHLAESSSTLSSLTMQTWEQQQTKLDEHDRAAAKKLAAAAALEAGMAAAGKASESQPPPAPPAEDFGKITSPQMLALEQEDMPIGAEDRRWRSSKYVANHHDNDHPSANKERRKKDRRAEEGGDRKLSKSKSKRNSRSKQEKGSSDTKKKKKKRRSKSRKKSKRSPIRKRLRNEALEAFVSNVRNARGSLGKSSSEERSARKRTKKLLTAGHEQRRTVRGLVADESDSENERKRAERRNLINVVMQSFDDLIIALIRCSDELELNATFRKAKNITNADALRGVLSYTVICDRAFCEIKPALLTLYDEGEAMENTKEGDCLQRINDLVCMMKTTVQSVLEKQEWNEKAETCFVSLLEILQRASVEFRCVHEELSEEEWIPTPELQRAWAASNHSDHFNLLETEGSEDRHMFHLILAEVISQTEKWAPPADDVKYAFGLAPYGGADSDYEDGKSYGPSASVPRAALDILGRIKGKPLPRAGLVARVLKRLIPSSTEDLLSMVTPSDDQSIFTIGTSSKASTTRQRGGNVIALSSVPEKAGDPDSLGMGGVGKTVIAALLANKEEVRRQYNGGVVWLDVGNREKSNGNGGWKYESYCTYLDSVCRQLKLRDKPNFPHMICVPGEIDAARERREQLLMAEARDAVSSLFRGRRGTVLLILDGASKNQDLDLFRFRWGRKKLCDIVVTTRTPQNLMVTDTVEVDLLSMEEGLQLLMHESDNQPDHVMASSIEAKSIVRECANHPLAIKYVARWLGLKHATAGVINSVEEIHEDVATALERITAATVSPDDEDPGDMLYEIVGQSLSPAVDGEPTQAIKFCFAAFSCVFCKGFDVLPNVPIEAACMLFEKLLLMEKHNLFEEGSTFESHFLDATQLIPEALCALGATNLVSEDNDTEATAHFELSHEIMLEYGDYLCSDVGGLDELIDDADRRWNQAFVQAVYLERKRACVWDGKDTDTTRDYALEKIISHCVRGDMLKEAAMLLKDERFIQGRLMHLGLEQGTKRHVRDCELWLSKVKGQEDVEQLDPASLIDRAYAKVALVLRDEGKKDDSAMWHYSPYEAGLAFHELAFSLAERGMWRQSISHYELSHEVLLFYLGDVELVAAILYNMTILHLQLNEFERALQLIEDCERIRLATSGEESLALALTLFEKGDVLSGMSDYNTAIECYKQALEIMQTEPNRNRIHIGNTLHSIGDLHFTKGELDESLKCYEESLRCKKIELGFSHHDLARVYGQMGHIFYQKEDFDSSLPLFEESLRVLKLTTDKSDGDEADILTTEGIMHLINGEQDEGLECYENALNILRSKLGHKKGKIASLLNAIACEYVTKGENKKAFRLFEESLHARKKMAGFVHLDVAATLENMAQLHQNREKYDKALRCLEEALRIRKLRLGDSAVVASTLETIGNISKEIGELKKSEMAYEDSLRIRKLVYGGGHETVANVLHEMGDLMDDISEYDEAVNYFSECLDIRKERLGDDHEDVAETLYSMGFALHNQGHYEDSLDAFDEALSIRKDKLGDNHDSVGDTLNIMGFVQAKRGELDESLRLLWDALRIRKLNEDNLKAADTLKNIGNVHREKQEYELAVECYEECLRIRKSEVGDEHEKVADALIALGNVKSDMSNHDRAMGCYQEALQIRMLLYGDYDDRVASILQNMGIMEFRSKNLVKAREFLEEFMRIRKMNHTDESADYVNVLFIIGNIHKIQGNDGKARENWAEAYAIFNGIGLAEQNPQIAKVLTNLLSGDDQKSKKSGGVFGRLTNGLSGEKVLKATKKKPMKIAP
uniref:NB-ARC domain-containing protein n=2 Tax=Odontella aurita TaxID=265563 RepID=A0A7S4J993_9STRA